MVENGASKDVEGLSGVGETVGVVREESGGVIFEFQGSFTEKHERPGGCKVAVGFPFDPNALVGFPGDLSPGTIEKAMLRGLLGARAAHLALWGEAHELEPGADWKALVEGEPNDGAYFS
jgi:hypothetical protein